jgi:hypothetical protein
MEFEFSAGELFLLVDENKIKRLISWVQTFIYLDTAAGPRGPLLGNSGRNMWYYCVCLLWLDPGFLT